MQAKQKFLSRHLMVGTSLMVLSGFMTAAHAQQAQEPQDPETVNEYPDEVVTVGRKVQTLQSYAGTAAKFDGEDLKLLGLQNINDLDGKIPGVSIANNQGNIEVYIRGVGSSNNTELGDPAAATHMNGVYVPRPSGFGAAFFDIERVEVNIGPQGTLRGRNATAGSVNIIPWQPGIGYNNGSAEISFGNYGEWRAEGVYNATVTENSALRIAAFMMEHDSHMESVTPCSAELNLLIPTCEDEGVGVAEAADDFGIRAAYAIEPNDKLRITLTGDYLEQKGTGYTGINYANPLGNGINPEDIDDPRKVVGRAFTPEEDTEHWGIKGHVEYDFGNFSAEYIGSYRDLVYDYDFVTPAGPFYEGVFATLGALDYDNFSRVNFTTDSESMIHEVRFFANPGQKLDWTVGGFYFKEDQRTFLGTTGDRNPFFYGVEFNQFTDTESYSFYGDATYEVTDRFRVGGGLRYTDDHKERFGVNARYGQTFIIGGDGYGCCFAPGVGTEGFEFAGFDRTIFNPDTNGNSLLEPQEIIDFYFDGVRTFGARDGLDDIYGNGEVPGDPNFPGPRPICPDPLIGFDGTSGGSCFTQGTSDAFDPGGLFNSVVGRVSFAVVEPTFTSIDIQNGALDNDFVDGRIRFEYDVSDQSLLYGLVATGNKSGGFNDNISELPANNVTLNPAGGAPVEFSANGIAPTYGPETLTLYEMGSKNQFMLGDNLVKFNVSAFYYDYKDLQLTSLLSVAQIADFIGEAIPANGGGNIVAFTFNASDAEIWGAQLEAGIQLPGDFNIDATLLWLEEAKVVESQDIQDSRYQADVDAVNAVNRSIEGNRLPRTPKWQLNGTVSKAVQLDSGQIDGVLSFGYRSSQHMTIFNGIDYNPNDNVAQRLLDEVDGYWTFDVGAGYSHGDDGKWRIEAYISNLTNQQKEQAIIITQFDNTRFFSRPRTYGARLRMSF